MAVLNFELQPQNLAYSFLLAVTIYFQSNFYIQVQDFILWPALPGLESAVYENRVPHTWRTHKSKTNQAIAKSCCTLVVMNNINIVLKNESYTYRTFEDMVFPRVLVESNRTF